MNNTLTQAGLRHLPLIALIAFAVSSFTPSLRAQSPLDVGIHFSPQLRYISSTPLDDAPTKGILTSGKDGLSVGAGVGAYLEYAITPHWFLRGGIDYSYKRNHYATERAYPEQDTVRKGSNQVIFTSIEIPVAVLYRFDFLKNDNSFLLGIGTTLNRWNGNPRLFSTFVNRRSAKDAVEYAKRSVTVFGGYEHYLSSTVVLGLEPYLAYVPTRFSLETTTTAKVQLEAGLSLRLHLDN